MRNLARQRILVVAPYPPPNEGTATPTRVLVQWLLKRNYVVSIVNTMSGDKVGISLLHPRALFPFVRMLVSFLWKVLDVDMVVVMGTSRFSATAGALFCRIAKLFGKPHLLYVHGAHLDNFLASLSDSLRLTTIWWMFAARIVVQTKWLNSRLSVVFPSIKTVHNWTQLPVHVSKRRIEIGKCRFCFVGRVREEKGVIDLMLAFKQARVQAPWITLDVIGPIYPPFKDKFERVFRDIGEGVVVHRGDHDHAQAMSKMECCDILVFPTRYQTEGYPGVILEAFARGIPVIATVWLAASEIIKEGFNGLLVDPDNVARELPEAMMKLAGDPELYERLSAGALESAKRFDIEVVGPRLLELLEAK